MHNSDTTTIPCPPWCTLPDGHGFDQLGRDNGVYFRVHFCVGRQIDTGRAGGASVDLAQGEELGPDGVHPAAQIAVSVSGYCEGDEMTGPQTRTLAAALLNAADEWDRITGASS